MCMRYIKFLLICMMDQCFVYYALEYSYHGSFLYIMSLYIVMMDHSTVYFVPAKKYCYKG